MTTTTIGVVRETTPIERRVGAQAGADVLADVPSRAADEATLRRASTAVDEAELVERVREIVR